jgi:hypothetical protein
MALEIKSKNEPPMNTSPSQHDCCTNNEDTDSAFPLFPFLPKELQQEIWRLAATAEANGCERLQRMAPDFPRARQTAGGADVALLSIINQNPVPSLLQVNGDSRHAAKEFYELWPNENGGKIYVNETCDVFYFGDTQLMNFWFLKAGMNVASWGDETVLFNLRKQLRGARHLAFDEEIFALLMNGMPVVWAQIFENIETVTIVFQNHDFPREAVRKFREMPEALMEKHFSTGSEQWLRGFQDVLKSYPDGTLHGPTIKIAMSIPEGGAEGKDEDYWAGRISLAPWAIREAQAASFLNRNFMAVQN